VKKSHVTLILIAVIALAAFLSPALDMPWADFMNWAMITAILAILGCVAFFFEFESSTASSKEVASLAMLGTLSAVLRVPFAALPGVQPCTYLIMCSGYVFGPIAGFVVGAMTPLVSNFFLGHGPWTLYQMIAWGLVGLASGYLRKVKMNQLLLISLGILWGYLYGLITNLWFWTTFIYPLTLNTLIVTQMSAIWFDTLHAAGNAIFMGLLGMKTILVLCRFRERFSITVLR
jgi:energy-coupling factor transport system substrate-specific component